MARVGRERRSARFGPRDVVRGLLHPQRLPWFEVDLAAARFGPALDTRRDPPGSSPVLVASNYRPN